VALSFLRPFLASSQPVDATAAPMTLREINLAMIALTMSIFVAMLSNLVVLTALPRIVADLKGTQAAYTWIITSSMLTITVCTPIWGRISDLLNKKRLMQLCVVGYVLASVVAGLAPAVWVMIACRVIIGICAGGIIVLMQSISVAITSPRHRAKWIGYRGAVMSVATVGAPSLGGFITEHFGWRWCFFVGVPVAIASIIMVQRTLRLPANPPMPEPRPTVDWAGALLLSCGITAVMLWVSVVGPGAGWMSPQGLALIALGMCILAFTIGFELRVPFPILPVELFRQREVLLCVLAAVGTGIAFFGSSVFLAIYLQIGRGLRPDVAGLMALPEAAGTLIGAMVGSRFIARHGRYRIVIIVGSGMILTGFAVLATIGTTTPLALVGVCVALIGGGLGMAAENLVLVVQTAVASSKVGAAGALVAFFRILGGVLCVAVMGAILSAHVAAEMMHSGVTDYDASSVPNVERLSGALRVLIEAAYAHGASLVYLACVPAALLILGCALLLPERTLEPDVLSPPDPLVEVEMAV